MAGTPMRRRFLKRENFLDDCVLFGSKDPRDQFAGVAFWCIALLEFVFVLISLT